MDEQGLGRLSATANRDQSDREVRPEEDAKYAKGSFARFASFSFAHVAFCFCVSLAGEILAPAIHCQRSTPPMVALLTLELAIEHAQSLKDRRQAVRSLKDKLRHGFNVSVAELDEAPVWNRVTIGVAAVSGSARYLAGQMREVEDAARRLAAGLGCEVLDSFIEADVLLEE